MFVGIWCSLSSMACEAGTFEAFAPLQDRCPPARARIDESCCPAWTAADGMRCTLRPWQTADVGDAIGDPGARDPQLAIDGADLAVLAWEATAGDTTEVWVGEETASGRARTRRPARALEGDASAPALAAHADGRAIVVWEQHHAGAAAIHESARGTLGGWRDPGPGEALSWPVEAREPRVAFGPGDESIVLWTQSTGADARIVVLERGHEDARDPSIVSPPGSFAGAPRLAIAPNGDALVTWSRSDEAAFTMSVSERVRQAGQWSRPGPVDIISAPSAPVSGDVEPGPMLAIGVRGAAAVAWAQGDGAGASRIFLATRDGLGEWTAPDAITDSLSDPDVVADDPQVAIGPRGELWVAWTEDLGEHHRVVAVVRDREGAWIEDGRDPAVLSTPGTDAIAPALAVGPYGEAVLVYTEVTDQRRVVVARRRHLDGRVWLEPDILSDDADHDASEPVVAVGPSGRTVAAWVQGPPDAGRVRLAWVD